MTYNLADYVNLKKLKSGAYRVSYSIEQESNTHQLLVKMGYRRKHDGIRYRYIMLEGKTERHVELSDIRRVFIEFFNTSNFDVQLTELEKDIITNWFWEKKNRVRENDLFKHNLTNLKD